MEPEIQYIFLVDLLDVALSSIEFLTFREKSLLWENLSCADELCSLSREDIGSIIGRKIKSSGWDGNKCLALTERCGLIMERFGIKAVSCRDPGYPAMLSESFDPPYVIYFRGNLGCLEKKCVSIVGTRRICARCAESTRDFASECASNGLTVVSGLAYGVDTFAHKGALSVDGGLTAAVLPGGIDSIAPRGNTALAARILGSGGLLMSEYLPGLQPEAWRFVKRNRIVAALSSVTVVTQAPPGSGALITAGFALDYNRYLMFHSDCFCAEAMETTEKAVRELRMKNTGAAMSKLENSAESYVRDGAPVFSDFSGFLRALECDAGRSGQLELEF